MERLKPVTPAVAVEKAPVSSATLMREALLA